MKTIEPFFTTLALVAISVSAMGEEKSDQPVHLFILSGQSNMAGMNPETGFMPEAKKLFKDEKVDYIKVAKGGQPICRWVKEWEDIAKKKGLDSKRIQRITKGEGVQFYQPILDQYKEMLEKYPNPTSVTFCWMQGERDASGGADAAYKDALKLLIANLRRDLKRPDMNFVIGRISDAAPERPSWVAVRKAQREIVNEDPRGAWVDVDDLNNREKDGKVINAVHYTKEGYITLGRRFVRQGHALVTGKKPAEDGKPGHEEPKEKEKKEEKKKRAEAAGPRWQVSTTEDWRAFIADTDGVKIADGHVSEVQEAPAFNGRRSFLAPRAQRHDFWRTGIRNGAVKDTAEEMNCGTARNT